MKILALSDLHGYLPEITESADVLFICGDISPLNIQRNHPRMDAWLKTTFIEWIKNIPVDKVYLVAGNHDITLENRHSLYDTLYKLSNWKLVYLENDFVSYDDGKNVYTIFGTPYCKIFGNWAFMLEDETLTKLYKQIPDKVDFLLTHDAPYNIGNQDSILENPRNNYQIEHVGNKPLAKRLSEIEYKMCFHGHIHSSEHTPEEFNGGKIVNVSILNERYEPYYPIFSITYE